MTIVNDVDGEEVPGVPEDFQYLEHGYDWGGYAPDPNFLVGCDCTGSCNGADIGGCCIRHVESDPEELLGFWYDKWVCFLHMHDFGIMSLTSRVRASSALIAVICYSRNAI